MSQGEAGTGNVVEAVRHCRAVMGAIRALQTMDDDELYVYAKEIRAPGAAWFQFLFGVLSGFCMVPWPGRCWCAKNIRVPGGFFSSSLGLCCVVL